MDLTASQITHTGEPLRCLSQEGLQVPACSVYCIGKAFGGYLYEAILQSIGLGISKEGMLRNLSCEFVWNQVN